MATFELTRTMAGDPEQVFAVVADLPAHGDYLPLTRIEHDRSEIGPGWSFTGYSGVGPLALIDRMQVTRWEPPHRFAIRKRGPVLLGWAEVEFTGQPDHTTLVQWREDILVRPTMIGRRITPLTDRFNIWLFGRALDAMAERSAAARPE